VVLLAAPDGDHPDEGSRRQGHAQQVGNDRGRAWARLRRRFPQWSSVVVEEAAMMPAMSWGWSRCVA
jgi:hypothetical protein